MVQDAFMLVVRSDVPAMDVMDAAQTEYKDTPTASAPLGIFLGLAGVERPHWLEAGHCVAA